MRIRLIAAVLGTAAVVGAVPATALATGSTGATTTATTPTVTLPVTTTTTPTTPTTPAPTTTTTPAPPAKPKPVQAKGALYLSKLFTVKHDSVTVPGRNVTIHAVVRPYRPGQTVVLSAWDGKKLFVRKTLKLAPSKKKIYGGFTITLRAPAAGNVAVQIKHKTSTALKYFTAERHYSVLSEQAGFGSTGRFVQLIQQRLQALHLYIPQTGVYDSGTGLAVDAYNRLLGRGEGHQTLTAPVVNALLNGQGAFHVRFPKQGRHAEGDLSDQVLALIDGSKVQMLFPISSGKPSTPTILGSYQVYMRTPGYLPDGMYYSSFFIRGYAIHGYDPAPDYPASHGCMRLPIQDAITAFNWLALGDWVDTYYT